MVKNYKPTPIFSTLEDLTSLYKKIYSGDIKIIKEWLEQCFSTNSIPNYSIKDFQHVISFLYSYRGSQDTFDAYRRDLERLIQWSWFVQNKAVIKLKREDIEEFIDFCKNPFKAWIGLKNVSRFKLKDGLKKPNPEWRPFVVSVSKAEHKSGKSPNKSEYKLSQQALKAIFSILSSFYNFLIQEEIINSNPISLIRQKSKFIVKQHQQNIRRLTNKQWNMVINLASIDASNDKSIQRTVFILNCLFGMYLRISELVCTNRWQPKMSDFNKDYNNNWWFKTTGKGNKIRQIAVSTAMLNALKKYRTNYLNLPALPTPNEDIPLIGHLNNYRRPITSSDQIRKIVQVYFDKAANELISQGNSEEAEELKVATVHWLRHTGISEDVKHRPREHVRDDAGHSSSSITDRYIDISLSERAKSAKNKKFICGE